jgi:hypothetical protein
MVDKIFRLKALAPEALAALRLHQKQAPMVKATSHRRRMGENGINAPSIYNYSRWYTWTKAKRDEFKALLPEALIQDAMVGWHLVFPPVTGFLDRMTTWVGEVRTGTVVSYNLGGDCEIFINDKPVTIKTGEAVAFNLRLVHEIKCSAAGQSWASIMTLHKPDKYGDKEIVQ